MIESIFLRLYIDNPNDIIDHIIINNPRIITDLLFYKYQVEIEDPLIKYFSIIEIILSELFFFNLVGYIISL